MLKEIMSNLMVVSMLSLIGSFVLVYIIIPRISTVIQTRNLIEHPNDRSSHSKATPTMAGVAFFITIIMEMYFIQFFDKDSIGLNLIAAITLIFVVGLKDDLLITAPLTKLFMEFLGIIFIIVNITMEVSTFHGFLGIQEIPYILSKVFVVILMLSIINAYNLIDGIDGLASIIAIIICSIFALIFYYACHYFYFFMCLSLLGMLTAYLIYNFSPTKKIFMGDTGSLIVGFCIAFLALKYLVLDVSNFSHFQFKPENVMIVLVGILWIPFFDMLRIIGVRLLNGNSPFYPDRNHIHHILVDCGMPHYKVALLLGALNVIIVVLILLLSKFFNYLQMLGILILIFVALLIVFYKLKLRNDMKSN